MIKKTSDSLLGESLARCKGTFPYCSTVCLAAWRKIIFFEHIDAKSFITMLCNRSMVFACRFDVKMGA
jgi:hypothetical protein